MRERRLLDIEESLYYALFDLLSDWTEQELFTTDGLVYRFQDGSYLPINYFCKPEVYVNEILVPDSSYVINYNEAVVSFLEANNIMDRVKIKYKYVIPKIVFAFPDMLNEVVDLPTVAIEYDMTVTNAVELGSSLRRRYNDRFVIGVYASSAFEKYVIASKITDGLLKGSLPILDLSANHPLTLEGTWNRDFNYWGQVKDYMSFEDVILRSFRSEKYGDVELHVMLIEFTVVTYF